MNCKYKEVSKLILGLIISEKYDIGDRLPSIRKLASVYKVSINI